MHRWSFGLRYGSWKILIKAVARFKREPLVPHSVQYACDGGAFQGASNCCAQLSHALIKCLVIAPRGFTAVYLLPNFLAEGEKPSGEHRPKERAESHRDRQWGDSSQAFALGHSAHLAHQPKATVGHPGDWL